MIYVMEFGLMNSYGVIGKSGKFYPCNLGEHVQTMITAGKLEAPFVTVSVNLAVFEAYYTCDKPKPTKAQFETLMNWCEHTNQTFEDVIDCFDTPWQEYIND